MDRKFHLVFICSRFITGGTEKYILNKSSWLIKNKGFRVTIISSGGDFVKNIPSDIDHYLIDGIQSPPFIFNKKNRWQIIHELERVIEFLKPDVIESFEVYPIQYVFSSGLPLKYKVFFNILTETGFKQNPILRLITHYFSKTSSLFFLGKSSRDVINKDFIFKIKKSKILPIPIEIKPKQINTDNNYILSVSRLSVDKLYVKFLLRDFVKLVENKLIDLDLVIVGEGNCLEEVKDELRNLDKKISSRVQFLGSIYGDELQLLFEKCTIFVGMGTSLLNAAAYGKPCIVATPDSNFKNFGIGIFGFEDNDDSFGQFTPNSRIKPFGEYIIDILDQKINVHKLGITNIDRIQNYYFLDNVVNQWHFHYTQKGDSRSTILFYSYNFLVNLIFNTHLFWRFLKRVR